MSNQVKRIKAMAGSRAVVAIVAAVATAVVIGGVGYASIPNPSGVINGCYKTSGTNHALTVINTAKTAHCPSGYTSLNWSQTGPQGPQGVQGVQGPQGTPATQCEVTDVNTSATYTDLQTALNDANSGDTLDITGECTGNYTDNLANVSLVGAPTAELNWGGATEVVPGNPDLQIGANDNATITNLLITGGGNGDSTALSILSGTGTVTLDGDTEVNDTTTANGAIYVAADADLIMNDNSQVNDNTWSNYGGGISNNGGTVTMNDNSQVDGNNPAVGNGYGGAGISNNGDSASIVQFTGNAQVENNGAVTAGAGGFGGGGTFESCEWAGAATPNVNSDSVPTVAIYSPCT
jgi:hypothetical protein